MEDSERVLAGVTASKGRVDKDVFIFCAVESSNVELVRLVLSCQDALLRQVELWKREESRRTRTHASVEQGMRCAIAILQNLHNKFLHSHESSNKEKFTLFYQYTLMDLGFIEICLWIANLSDKYRERSGGKNVLASTLIKAAYELLDKIIHKIHTVR